MSHSGDNVVLYLLIGCFLYLVIKPLLSASSVKRFVKFEAKENQHEPKGEIPDLLREHGYEVIQSKQKIEMTISVNEDSYDSRLYIDYIAKQDNDLYLVIVARDRKPLRISGPGLRDAFLSHYLLYQPQGILYVHRERGTIKTIDFEIADVGSEKSADFRFIYFLAIGFAIGIFITWLALK